MIPLCLVPFPLHVCRAQQDIDFFQSEPRHGQHHSQSFSAQEKVASGKCSTCLPSLPLPSSPPTHTCLQALTSWVTAGNSHPPAGPVLFLGKENSWVILKMEVKIHLTSQLQLSGRGAAFKDRSCGCDLKAKSSGCFVRPQQERLHTSQGGSKGLLLGCFGLILLFYKMYSLTSGLLRLLA